MKRNIIIITCCVALSFSVYAFVESRQNVAVVSIYKGSAPLFIIRDRSVLQRPANYEVTNIDNQNCSLIYKDNKPKVLYLNERPIYITPGDKVQLYFRRISEPGRERDTVIAIGDHAENYTYSYITMFDSKERREAIGMDYPNFADPKYSLAAISLYDDLGKYRALSRKYVDSVLSARSYNKNIIRQAELDDFVFTMFIDRGIENKLREINKIQCKDFARKLEQHFGSRDISANDTIYSPNIEGAISLYFGHLEEVKFAGVKTDQQLSEFVSYIRNYSNHFVREYLLCFLMQNYQSRLTEKYMAQIKPDLDKIKNPVIIAAPKYKVKKMQGIPDKILDLLGQ